MSMARQEHTARRNERKGGGKGAGEGRERWGGGEGERDDYTHLQTARKIQRVPYRG
jgi:hypothetical protein